MQKQTHKQSASIDKEAGIWRHALLAGRGTPKKRVDQPRTPALAKQEADRRVASTAAQAKNRLGPKAQPGPDGVMGTKDDGRGPTVGEMRKQNSAAYDSDERLYIDIAPDLIKHAQDMRKQAGPTDVTYAEGFSPAAPAAAQPAYSLEGMDPTARNALLLGGGGAILGGGMGAMSNLLSPEEEDEKKKRSFLGDTASGVAIGGLTGGALGAGATELGMRVGTPLYLKHQVNKKVDQIPGGRAIANAEGGVSAGVDKIYSSLGRKGRFKATDHVSDGLVSAPLRAYNKLVGLGKKSSSDERLYIDIAPDLIKHAQDMRKEGGGSWYYTAESPDVLEPAEKLYNTNLAQLLAVGGGAALLGGGAALVKALRRPSVARMAGSGTSTLPMELAVPQRKLVSRRKPEEEEEDRMDKAADGAAPQTPAEETWLGSDSAPMVKWPAMVGLGLGGFWGGNALGDYLAARRRKRLRAEAVRDAKEEYESAIADQFATSKEASALGSSLDGLYDGFVKMADPPTVHIPRPPGSDISVDDVTKGLKQYGGFLALMAAVSGIPTGMAAYNWTRNKSRNKSPLSEAMRRRKADLARRRPQPIYLTPGEEVLHEEKEDDPILASV